MPTTITPTHRALAKQFTENTGRHFLDSGDAYGRGWQRKAGMAVRDFVDKPEARVEYDYLSLSTFHYLSEFLDYDSRKTSAFKKWAEKNNDPWLVSAEEWAERHAVHLGGKPQYRVVNTYNYDTLFDEVVQYVEYEDMNDGETYWLLQTHNGCDVRGGYSMPRIYRVDDSEGAYRDGVVVWCPGTDRSGEQTEALDGMPDVPADDHGWDVRAGYGGVTDFEGIDLDGKEWEEAVKLEDGKAICLTHSRECVLSGEQW